MSERHYTIVLYLTLDELIDTVSLMDNGYGDGEFFMDEDGATPDDPGKQSPAHTAWVKRVYDPLNNTLIKARNEISKARPPYSKDGKMQLCSGCNKYVSRNARFCPRCNI